MRLNENANLTFPYILAFAFSFTLLVPSKVGRAEDCTQTVRDLVKTAKVILFSKTQCPHSLLVKKMLNDVACDFQVIELDQRPDGECIMGALGRITGHATVPSVFVKGVFLGDFEEMEKIEKSGQLKQRIA